MKVPPQYLVDKINKINKMNEKTVENNASTPTAAKAQRTKPTQAAVCVDATVEQNLRY